MHYRHRASKLLALEDIFSKKVLWPRSSECSSNNYWRVGNAAPVEHSHCALTR